MYNIISVATAFLGIMGVMCAPVIIAVGGSIVYLGGYILTHPFQPIEPKTEAEKKEIFDKSKAISPLGCNTGLLLR